MSDRRLVAVLIWLVLLMTVLLAPLRLVVLALGDTGAFGVAGVSGTVWSGRLKGAAVAGQPLGDLKAGLDPLALLTGKVRLGLSQDPPGLGGRARVLLTGGQRGVDGLSLQTPIDLTGAGLPLTGVATVKDAAALFRAGRCVVARGQIGLKLSGPGPLAGTSLSGVPVCRGDSWTANLTGRAGDAKVTVAARIDAPGRYQVEMAVATTDSVMAQGLLAAGFSRDAAGFRRTLDGRLLSSAQSGARQ